jgi:hypothetical protein
VTRLEVDDFAAAGGTVAVASGTLWVPLPNGATSIRVLARLREQYGDTRWRKLKGIAFVRTVDGKSFGQRYTTMSATALAAVIQRS